MELTVSQIGSAATHWVPRAAQPASGGVRAIVPNTLRVPDDNSIATTGLHGVETEYDQFGRFGVDAATAVDRAEISGGFTPPRPSTNANKNFRSGNATINDLQREYAQSILDSHGDPAMEERHFVPFGMTEYQVYQLQDYQYRWMIEVERQAALAKLLEDKVPTT